MRIVSESSKVPIHAFEDVKQIIKDQNNRGIDKMVSGDHHVKVADQLST